MLEYCEHVAIILSMIRLPLDICQLKWNDAAL